MTARFVKSILLVLFLVTASCQQKPEKKTEKLAREQMTRVRGLPL
jgi:hypothetical protein